MKSGMARVVHYETFQPDTATMAARPNLYREHWYGWGGIDLLTNMSEGYATLADTRNILMARYEVGWENTDETEWEWRVTWNRYYNRFFRLFGGLDLQSEDEDETAMILGLRYLLPLNVESSIWLETRGAAVIDLEKEFAITPRIHLFGEVEYDTENAWEGELGVDYVICRQASCFSNGIRSLIGDWGADEFLTGEEYKIFFHTKPHRREERAMHSFGYHGNMMSIFGSIFMFLFWIMIILAVIYFAKGIFGRNEPRQHKEETAEEILKKRYARGELDKEDFERMRRELREGERSGIHDSVWPWEQKCTIRERN